MSSPGWYLAIALVAVLVTIWLAFQILGVVFRLLFLTAALVVGWAAVRAWRDARGME
jgi:hypothetical protein